MDQNQACHKKLIDICTELRKKTTCPIAIIQIPPIRVTVTSAASQKIYNRTLEISKELQSINISVINTQECYKDKDHDNLEDDNLHLTPEAGQELAKVLNREAKNILEQDQTEQPTPTSRPGLTIEIDNDPPKPTTTHAIDIPNPTKTVERFEIEENMVGHVIGKNGDQLAALRDEHNTHITINKITDTNGMNKRMCKITGTKEDVQKTRQHIKQIIQNRGISKANDQEARNRRATIPCRYFTKDGQCDWGDKCHFKHSTPQRLPSPSTREHQPRQRSQRDRESSHRHRSTHRTPERTSKPTRYEETEWRHRSTDTTRHSRSSEPPKDRRDHNQRSRSPIRKYEHRSPSHHSKNRRYNKR